jgi:tetratricopeptide (TPR) repeat protein
MTRAILGRLQEALADCEQSLRMLPNNPYTLDSRALVHLKRGDLDAAISDYDAALAGKPAFDSALYGRGLAKRKKGDAEGAERDIAAAKAITPDVADGFAKYGLE